MVNVGSKRAVGSQQAGRSPATVGDPANDGAVATAALDVAVASDVAVAGSSRAGRRFPIVAAIIATAALFLGACSDDEEPEMTIEERLAVVEGRALTAAEVDQRLDLGETLCRMDDLILGAVWLRLDEAQLEFQDVVFGHLCPERSTLYAAETGRVVNEAAEDVGDTSTTSPDSTPDTSQPSTTPATATITPTTAGGGPTTSSAPSTTGATIRPSTAPTTAPTTSTTSTTKPPTSVETSGPSSTTTTAPITTAAPPTTPATDDGALGQGG